MINLFITQGFGSLGKGRHGCPCGPGCSGGQGGQGGSGGPGTLHGDIRTNYLTCESKAVFCFRQNSQKLSLIKRYFRDIYVLYVPQYQNVNMKIES